VVVGTGDLRFPPRAGVSAVLLSSRVVPSWTLLCLLYFLVLPGQSLPCKDTALGWEGGHAGARCSLQSCPPWFWPRWCRALPELGGSPPEQYPALLLSRLKHSPEWYLRDRWVIWGPAALPWQGLSCLCRCGRTPLPFPRDTLVAAGVRSCSALPVSSAEGSSLPALQEGEAVGCLKLKGVEE